MSTSKHRLFSMNRGYLQELQRVFVDFKRLNKTDNHSGLHNLVRQDTKL